MFLLLLSGAKAAALDANFASYKMAAPREA